MNIDFIKELIDGNADYFLVETNSNYTVLIGVPTEIHHYRAKMKGALCSTLPLSEIERINYLSIDGNIYLSMTNCPPFQLGLRVKDVNLFKSFKHEISVNPNDFLELAKNIEDKKFHNYSQLLWDMEKPTQVVTE